VREIGGRGQERLLSGALRLVGQGRAQATAAAYLAAGGTEVDATGAPESGFGFDAPCAGSSPSPVGSLGEIPAVFVGPAPWIAIGRVGSSARVVVRLAQGCADCFRAATAPMREGIAPGLASAAGAVAALAGQRALLGLAEALEVVDIGADGQLAPGQPDRCEAHR